MVAEQVRCSKEVSHEWEKLNKDKLLWMRKSEYETNASFHMSWICLRQRSNAMSSMCVAFSDPRAVEFCEMCRGCGGFFLGYPERDSAAEQDFACHQEESCEELPRDALQRLPRKKDDYTKFSEQFGKCLNLCDRGEGYELMFQGNDSVCVTKECGPFSGAWFSGAAEDVVRGCRCGDFSGVSSSGFTTEWRRPCVCTRTVEFEHQPQLFLDFAQKDVEYKNNEVSEKSWSGAAQAEASGSGTPVTSNTCQGRKLREREEGEKGKKEKGEGTRKRGRRKEGMKAKRSRENRKMRRGSRKEELRKERKKRRETREGGARRQWRKKRS